MSPFGKRSEPMYRVYDEDELSGGGQERFSDERGEWFDDEEEGFADEAEEQFVGGRVERFVGGRKRLIDDAHEGFAGLEEERFAGERGRRLAGMGLLLAVTAVALALLLVGCLRVAGRPHAPRSAVSVDRPIGSPRTAIGSARFGSAHSGGLRGSSIEPPRGDRAVVGLAANAKGAPRPRAGQGAPRGLQARTAVHIPLGSSPVSASDVDDRGSPIQLAPAGARASSFDSTDSAVPPPAEGEFDFER
jgi:hypothetical protein